MRIDHQQTIFEIIKRKISGKDSIGNLVGEVLSISQDAVYRRFRGETLLTIYELEKLCRHFDISLDSIFAMNKNRVLFDFQPLSIINYSLESYLQGISDSLSVLKNQSNSEMTITINNTPVLQLMNFPHLLRFKLFFWAKTHLQIKELQNKLFDNERLSKKILELGYKILPHYNSIPSKELYDPELLGGFTREIYYYFQAKHFKQPEFALTLLRQLNSFVDHLKAQAKAGKKFTYGTQIPASGNDLEVYYNETLNSITSIHYKTDEFSGLYIAHNIMNSLHTSDPVYIEDSLGVLTKQFANSSKISIDNEKERNAYFSRIKGVIDTTRKKIERDLSE